MMNTTMKKKRTSSWMLNGLKLGVTGGIICAIAFGFIAFDNPKGEISPAEADVWSVFQKQTSKHEDFMSVLQKEGMQPPRQYDYNGNQVFFSYATTRESPNEVMLRFQEAFVREGVNSHFHPGVREPADPMHLDPQDPEEFGIMMQGMVGADDFFTGGMVPIQNTRNKMAMVGVTTKQDVDSLIAAVVERQGGETLAEDMIGSIRYMDATREQGSLKTTITAVWSDDKLDMRKFRSEVRSEDTVHPIEFEIPTCQGCTRVARFSGTESEQHLHNLLFRSPGSIHEVTSFYDRHMGRYGWELEPAMRGLNLLQQHGYAADNAAQIRSYIKNEMHLTVVIYPDYEDGYTYVKMITSI